MTAARTTHPSRLPTPLTRLVGRQRELGEVHHLLLQPHVRLLTLTGPGGVGKTRLAIAAASAAAARFSDGVAFVPLAPITDPGLVAATIMTVLGLAEVAGQAPVERLVTYFADRAARLVLDNFEQVVDAAPLVGTLVAPCPSLTILVTSRVPLHLSGEQDYLVQPLRFPAREPLPMLEQLGQVEAVALFVQRAREHRADFQLTTENAAAVVDICRRLDGLPLAIELATARIRLLTPHALAQRLDQRLPLLSGGPRDAPTRQQTLRATIGWSYDLLPPPVQWLFRQLAVFAGGWTLEAAEAVCASDHDVFEGLATLVDHSLVWQGAQPDGSTRFGMLETIRDYGLELLTASGEEGDLRDRHADYYAQLAQAAGAQFDRPDVARWLVRLDAEQDNLRAALAWLRELGDAERGLELVGELGRWWINGGQLSEGWAQTDAFLALPGAAAPTAGRAKALVAAGMLALWRDGHQRSMSLYEEALQLWQALGDRRRVPNLLNVMAVTATSAGDLERVHAYCEQALALARDLGDQANMARALTNLGSVADEQGDEVAALSLWQESLVLARASGNIQVLALSLLHLAEVSARHGDLEQAAARYHECLVLYRDLGITWGLTRALESVAHIASVWGHAQLAARLWAAATTLRASLAAPIPAGIGRTVSPGDTTLVPGITDVRTTLGEEAFQRAWAAGAAMPLAAVVGEALAMTPPSVGVAAHPSEMAPGHGLSQRELDVLRLLVEGKSNQEIADALFISYHTANRHVTNILTKLAVESRTAAATYAMRHRLVDGAPRD